MKFTMLGHSAIAIAAPEGTIVIDPGSLTNPACLKSADAVLLTHAHPDHFNVDAVRNSGLPVWGTAEAIAALGDRAEDTVVQRDSEFDILGQHIRVFGGQHAEIHPSLPRPENLGYYMDGLLHPGDEYVECPLPVEVLLLPIAAPWVKGSEAADYAVKVGARVTIPIHDAVLSPGGKAITDGMLGKVGVPGYQRVETGETVEF